MNKCVECGTPLSGKGKSICIICFKEALKKKA